MNPSMMSALKSTKPTYGGAKAPVKKPVAAPQAGKSPLDMSGSFSDVADRINAQKADQGQGSQLDVKVDGQDLTTPDDIASWVVSQPDILKAVQMKMEQGNGNENEQGNNEEY